MADITLTGIIRAIKQTNNAANVLVVDKDSFKNTAYKVTFWDSEAITVLENMEKDDEITVSGKVFDIVSNNYGNYIDVRMCKLERMAKLQRSVVTVQISEASGRTDENA